MPTPGGKQDISGGSMGEMHNGGFNFHSDNNWHLRG